MTIRAEERAHAGIRPVAPGEGRVARGGVGGVLEPAHPNQPRPAARTATLIGDIDAALMPCRRRGTDSPHRRDRPVTMRHHVSVFSEHEAAYLRSQRIARLATASATGEPDVAAVTFGIEADTVVSGGYDITKTVRYGNLIANPRAVIVIDDLPSTDPWAPRGIKIRGRASIEDPGGPLQIRITPEVIWSWGLNPDGKGGFHGVQRRNV
jgi:pyridoxamine 5'-phosphate oxidase family protein